MPPRPSVLLAALALTMVAPAAGADEALLVYLGGAVGQSQVDVNALDASAHDTAWKILAGVRAIDYFGGEVAYVDLGRPRTTTASGELASRATGPVVFGVAYLPLPTPNFDLYAKAGVANIQQRATVTLSNGSGACAPGIGCDGLNRTESEFAWGAGAQLKAGPIAVRVEYEQFRASGGDLSLGSVSVLWNFL